MSCRPAIRGSRPSTPDWPPCSRVRLLGTTPNASPLPGRLRHEALCRRRLWAEALDNDPKLAADRETRHPYNAACAAALAASARGKDGPADSAAKHKLRKQAPDWLRASSPPGSRSAEGSGPGPRLHRPDPPALAARLRPGQCARPSGPGSASGTGAEGMASPLGQGQPHAPPGCVGGCSEARPTGRRVTGQPVRPMRTSEPTRRRTIFALLRNRSRTIDGPQGRDSAGSMSSSRGGCRTVSGP